MPKLRHILAIWRRDFAGYFTTPSAISVGMLFLALSGWQFWLIVDTLSDPAQPAPFGALLESFFGGHPLFWGVLFVLVAAISMSSIAGEKRSGNWELLTTSPASDGAIVIGKWLACVTFYGVVWLPTLAFPVIVALLHPGDANIDPGPIAAAYVAMCAVGAMSLAIGVCASTATEHPMIAATATFGTLMALLFVGELGDGNAATSSMLSAPGLRQFLGAAARGELKLPSLLYCAALAAAALVLARALAASRRLHKRRVRARLVSALLTVIVCAELLFLAVRHPVSVDWSSDNRNRLSATTISVLQSIESPVQVALVRPTFDNFTPVYDEAERLLRRMAEVSPLLRLEEFDPVDQRLGLEEIAARFASTKEQLQEGGLVLFRTGDRVELVELLDMADFASDETLGAGSISSFRAERAFASALATLAVTWRPRVCVVENAYDSSSIRESVGLGFEWHESESLRQALAARCQVIAVFGPVAALSGADTEGLNRFLAADKGLLWAAPETPRSQRSAFGEFVALQGIDVTDAVAIDPQGAVDLALAWATATGYANHPTLAGFRERRLTLWQAPRALRLLGEATALIFTSDAGWPERDPSELAAGGKVARDDQEKSGAVPIAASATLKSGGRLVVVGGAGSLTRLGQGTANALFAARAIAWLAGSGESVSVPERRVTVTRIVLSEGKKRSVMLACVLLIPGLFGALCALLWWRRRRG